MLSALVIGLKQWHNRGSGSCNPINFISCHTPMFSLDPFEPDGCLLMKMSCCGISYDVAVGWPRQIRPPSFLRSSTDRGKLESALFTAITIIMSCYDFHVRRKSPVPNSGSWKYPITMSNMDARGQLEIWDLLKAEKARPSPKLCLCSKPLVYNALLSASHPRSG